MQICVIKADRIIKSISRILEPNSIRFRKRKISMTYAREHLVAILYCHVIVNKPLKGQRKTAS